jgi:predicted enzyme related to lactoylglutathione lyase
MAREERFMTKASNVSRRTAIGAAIAGMAAIAAGGEEIAVGQEASERERVQGIGGFFFRAKDPKKLSEWYERHLGIARVPETYEGSPWRTAAGTTIFAPFREDTSYFGDPRLQWMINFRVRDLQKLTDQLRAEGIEVELDPEVHPNGRFARLSDPEGNPIQLWQPGGVDPG